MKLIIYAKFCDYSQSGITYVTFDESMREYLDSNGEHTFVTELDVPEIDNSEVVKMGVKSIDESIAKINAEAHRDIETLKAKKEQLLALTHDNEA
jgi:hypothetical protein|tara:strand:+ start:1709 stop:1993 length:285 start_codon:yes stop_codon:yes gene_type:complete